MKQVILKLKDCDKALVFKNVIQVYQGRYQTVISYQVDEQYHYQTLNLKISYLLTQ